MIDIGANLTDHTFAADLSEVLDRAVKVGIERILVTGTSLASSGAARALAGAHPHLLASTAGVHPHEAKSVAVDWLSQLAALAEAKEVIAIGETGLDFNRNFSPPEVQESVFRAQIELAAGVGLPLFVHDRESEGETLRLLRDHAHGVPGIVIHCFTGTRVELERYLHAGYHIGITGWICDERRGLPLRDMVHLIPDDRLLIETDAPYLLPRTMRPRPKTRRNEPAYLPWVAREVADARGVDVATIERLTTANARRLFRVSMP